MGTSAHAVPKTEAICSGRCPGCCLGTCQPLCDPMCQCRGCGSFPPPPQPHAQASPEPLAQLGGMPWKPAVLCVTHTPERDVGGLDPALGRGASCAHSATLRQGLPVQSRVLRARGRCLMEAPSLRRGTCACPWRHQALGLVPTSPPDLPWSRAQSPDVLTCGLSLRELWWPRLERELRCRWRCVPGPLPRELQRLHEAQQFAHRWVLALGCLHGQLGVLKGPVGWGRAELTGSREVPEHSGRD